MQIFTQPMFCIRIVSIKFTRSGCDDEIEKSFMPFKNYTSDEIISLHDYMICIL